MNFSNPMLEGDALDFIFYLAIAESAFQGNELPLLESLGYRQARPEKHFVEEVQAAWADFICSKLIGPSRRNPLL